MRKKIRLPEVKGVNREFLGIMERTFSGQTVESPNEVEAMMRAGGEKEKTKPIRTSETQKRVHPPISRERLSSVTKTDVSVPEVPAPTRKRERPEIKPAPRRTPRTINRVRKVQRVRTPKSMPKASLRKRVDEAVNLALIPLVIIGLIGFGIYHFTSSATSTKAQSAPKISATPALAPQGNTAPAPQGDAQPVPAPTPAPKPKISATPAPQPKGLGSPAPQGGQPCPGGPVGTIGGGTPTPVVKAPAVTPILPMLPATPRFDQTDGTPGGSSQADSKTPDSGYKGESQTDGSQSNNSGGGNAGVDPATDPIGTVE